MIRVEMPPFSSKLWLAAKVPGAQDDPEQSAQVPGAEASALRILIVEDEFYIALDIEALLAGLGCNTVGIAVSADPGG
jgi:hypothetical protein